jgi:caa(3)-type oxidase subunit IV
MSDTTSTTLPGDTHTHAHEHEHEHDWAAHIKTYIIVGAILFGGTCFTVMAAQMDIFDLHHRWLNIALGLTIATVKCSLVALIFMHLKNEKTIIFKFLIFTSIFFAVMMFLFLSAQSDPLPADKSHNMVFKK